MPVFLISIRLAFRARYVGLMIFSIALLIISALLASKFAGRQPATVALDIGISVIRLMLPIVVVVMSQELVFREFDRRYYLGSFTYPRARLLFLLGRFSAITVLSLVLLFVMALVLAGVVKYVGVGYEQGTHVSLGLPYLIVVSFIALDVTVLAALACFLGAVASTSSFVLVGTLGVMLVARSYAVIIELLSQNAGVVSDADTYGRSLGLLGYLLPDLGSLDVRMIALYDRMAFLPSDWYWLVLSSVSYCFFLLAFSAWALSRKRMS